MLTITLKTHFITKLNSVYMNTVVTAMEARMTAAESLAEELQMENDGKHHAPL